VAKASANLFPYVHLVPAAAPASPAAGAERIYLDSGDGNKLKRKNSSGTVTTVEGGGGTAVKDRRWQAGASETTIDELNDDSLDAAWVRVDGTGAASGNVTWLEEADVLSVKHTAADTGNASHGMVRPIGTAPATGDAWVTCLTMFAAPNTNYVLAGLVISDGTTHGSGKQVFAELGSNAGSANQQGLTAVAGSNWNNTGATVSSTLSGPPIGTPMFIRLVYRGSSQWRADFSPNGTQWITGGSMVTQSSFTPSHVGYYSRDGGSGLLAIASFDMIRRVASVS
jgi:hypothetical protein